MCGGRVVRNETIGKGGRSERLLAEQQYQQPTPHAARRHIYPLTHHTHYTHLATGGGRRLCVLGAFGGKERLRVSCLLPPHPSPHPPPRARPPLDEAKQPHQGGCSILKNTVYPMATQTNAFLRSRIQSKPPSDLPPCSTPPTQARDGLSS